MSSKAPQRISVLFGRFSIICLLAILFGTGHWQVAQGGPDLVDATGDSVPVAVESPLNQALNFDGDNDIVDLGVVSVLTGVSQYTIEVWVKFETFSAYGTVFAKRTADNDRAAMLQAWDANGNIAVAVNNGYGYTSEPLSPGQWYHIAVVYDGAQATDHDRLKLYVDGSPKSLTFLDEVPNATPASPSRFTLGAEYSGTEPINESSFLFVPFDGTIAELRIWSVARTQSQIQAEKETELTGSETGLAHYYDFSQGVPYGDNSDITTLIDRVEPGQDGTLWNFNLVGPVSNWTSGVFDPYFVYTPLVVRND